MEYIYRSTDDPSSKWYAINLRHALCPHCEYFGECQQDETMPVISPLARYILRWHSEMKVVPKYPLDGTWENQPVWFGHLTTVVSNTYNRLEQERAKPNGN